MKCAVYRMPTHTPLRSSPTNIHRLGRDHQDTDLGPTIRHEDCNKLQMEPHHTGPKDKEGKPCIATKEERPSLSYVEGLSQRACKQLRIRLVFKSGRSRTIRCIHMRVNNTVKNVYKVKCTCSSTYIGGMNRILEFRSQTEGAPDGSEDRQQEWLHANVTWHSIEWMKSEIENRTV